MDMLSNCSSVLILDSQCVIFLYIRQVCVVLFYLWHFVCVCSACHQGIVERDRIVFQKVRTCGIPILMLTSGGYMRETARIIANSILNLRQLGLIACDAAEVCMESPSSGDINNIYILFILFHCIFFSF